MRRSNDFQGLDQQPGVSSRGPTVPILFGRATLLAPADPHMGYSPRHHGVTVRATAIASAQPARSVGAAYLDSEPDAPGALPFAIRASQWLQMTDACTLNINSVNRRHIDDASHGHVGFVVSADAISTETSVGLQVDSQEAAADFVAMMISNAAEINESRQGYLLIVGDSTYSPADHVIGFGFVKDIVQTESDEFQVTKHTSYIAPENAAAIPITPIPDPIAAHVIAGGFALGQHALLAPALVR
jgi:hypothetical protein